jgi:hypothetical protein
MANLTYSNTVEQSKAVIFGGYSFANNITALNYQIVVPSVITATFTIDLQITQTVQV